MGEQVAVFLAVRAPIAPALFFILGIALPARWPWPLAAAALLLIGVGQLCDRRGWPGGWLALLLAWLACGSVLAGLRTARASPEPALRSGEERLLEGEVVERAGSHAVLRVDRLAPAPAAPLEPARLRVALSGLGPEVLPGEQVRLLARLFRSEAPSNPGEQDPVARDLERAIDLHGVVRPGEWVRLGPAPPWQRLGQRLRERFASEANPVIPGEAERALVLALAVGDRQGIDPELNERFNASGLAHILSVSGLHIAVVALGLLAVLRWLLLRSTRLALRWDVKRVAGLMALPAIWAYVILTGAEVPAVRSGIMATALVAARLVHREPEPFTALAWAAVLCLGLDPSSLHDVSFQLSFVAVLGLMALAGPLRAAVPLAPPHPSARGWRALRGRALEAVLTGATSSLAASLATAPIVASTFHRESLVAVLANIVALPVATGLTAVSALAAAFTPVPPLARLLLHAAGPLAHLLVATADGFGRLPFAQLRVAAPGLTTTLVYAVGLLAAALARIDRRAYRITAAAAVALVGLGTWRVVRPRLSRELSVTFLAVGQGDATFIRFPGGASLLVDGGGEVGTHYDPAGQILAPFLWDQGIAKLDAVALSHPHPDHALGLIGLAPLVPARELWMAADHAPGGLLEQLTQAMGVGGSGGPTVRRLSRGDTLPSWGGVQLAVLGPAPDAKFEKVNDQSLVLKLTYGDVTVLLPGDAESAAEDALVSSGAPLSATILKAPHHGSRTSSTPPFVQAVHPQYVVYCVGRDNRFHFPSGEVDARYEASACTRLRTDRDGAITFRTDGHRVEVEHFRTTQDWHPEASAI